ncbi:MAG: tetratricopeptide repeat protein [Candidatus Zixiibacteriota bacterium]|nr:MAG: tetratricopeptide repeat protein [candidate division Zixibacteria bacterium]
MLHNNEANSLPPAAYNRRRIMTGFFFRRARARPGIVLTLMLAGTVLICGGCGVYYNTFFNAKKAFNAAEKARKKSTSGKGGAGDYNRAIEKARKVVDNYPNSKYYDDALFVLGVSYFHTEQYSRAERRFRELLANYDDPDYTRDARLYLAKTKLQLNEVDDAMGLFEEIFQADYDRAYKAEAAMGLGEFHFQNGDWARAREYFMSVRDSLGSDVQNRRAQILIGDAFFESFQFGDALGAYLQVLGMDPDKNEKYRALFRAAMSSYRLLKIDDGLDYLQRLMDDELYYDSLAVIKLMVARGHEYEDDLELAQAVYEEVADGAESVKHQARANYQLGLIYQFDYDLLKEAKEYYDKAVEQSRTSEWGKEALQKSSDIGKIDTYRTGLRQSGDTSMTLEQIDEAALTQYQLAELYWFQLNKPDTAMLEMQYVVDSFPSAYDAPRAMIALSQMYRDHREDHGMADSILKEVLQKHPRSDYVPEALDILGLRGTSADTGYAAIYFHRAEDWLVDSANYDSARYNYQYVVDNFPDSKYHLQARFNLIWLSDEYQLPGDSSVIHAYQEFADSFPGSPLGQEARLRVTAQPDRMRQRPVVQDEQGEVVDTTEPAASQADTSGQIDVFGSLRAVYRGPSGEKLTDLKETPILIEEPFELPTEAYDMPDQGIELYFQVLIDFDGKVVDVILKVPSVYDELNLRATRTVQSMTFEPLKVSELITRFELQESADERGYWFAYKYLVLKPEYLR